MLEACRFLAVGLWACSSSTRLGCGKREKAGATRTTWLSFGVCTVHDSLEYPTDSVGIRGIKAGALEVTASHCSQAVSRSKPN